MNIFMLCLYFFLTGLFAIGGGLATIPLVQQFIVDGGALSPEMFYNMIAISESTPGPIGINLSTYVGFSQCGVFGGVLTTFSIVLPSFITILIIARTYSRFQDNRFVKSGLYGIRAAVAGLIATAAWSVLCNTIFTFDKFIETPSVFTLFNLRELIIYAVIFALYKTFKKHPIWYILFGAVCGIVFL